MEKQYFVYMVRCGDGSFYTGVTNDVDGRVWQHNRGLDEGCYTFARRPVVLVWSASFADVRVAIDWEKKIKGWSRRKKVALIKGDWKRISQCARGRNRRPSFDSGASHLRSG